MSKEKAKEVDEIAVGHGFGTQESVANINVHPSYMGQSIIIAQSSDIPVTSDAETGNKKPPVKVKKIKFANKLKPEEVQVELHKSSIVIKPPVETDRDQP
ncbi:hypothetical protein Vadar_034431 [Vaccinium darrowii]|uniref:Uncharacterized protein n=1 Tax=Vaccinium darrowii TaxID=229202 RepID=A0ACB7YAJ2_9ERIC|nr:hypothetical protein Vadar_034431 [Vaccinium darrowii]